MSNIHCVYRVNDGVDVELYITTTELLSYLLLVKTIKPSIVSNIYKTAKMVACLEYVYKKV